MGCDLKLRVLLPVEVGRTGLNDVKTEDQLVCEVWAAPSDKAGSEAVSAGREAGAVVTLFTVRSNAQTRSIASGHVLEHGATGRRWNVQHALAGDDGRGRKILITAVRVDGS